MNRILILVLCLAGAGLLLSGCGQSQCGLISGQDAPENGETTGGQDSADSYTVISVGEYDLDGIQAGVMDGDCVPDARTAQSIADAVILSWIGEERFKNLPEVSISYDPKERVWLVDRALGSDTVGGDIACAIRQSDGRILKVWGGE